MMLKTCYLFAAISVVVFIIPFALMAISGICFGSGVGWVFGIIDHNRVTEES